MNQSQTGKAPPAAAADKDPDVIVTRAEQTALFKMKNRTVSKWMREHYHSSAGSIKGDTEIRVHPARRKRIIEELKAAGFDVEIL
jgi:hypothetical protein